MRITIKLFATLRKGLFEIETREFNVHTTVRQVIATLLIPEKDVTLIFINGRHAELMTELADGDILSLFPPIGGG